MEKYTIANLERFDKNDKTGEPYVTKDGRPFTRIKLFVKEKPGVALSGFENKQTQWWKAGDKITLNIEEYINPKTLYKALNFRVPTVYDRLDMIEERLKVLESIKPDMEPLKETSNPFKGEVEPADEEVPF